MMIPGAWEPRARSGAAAAPLAPAPLAPAPTVPAEIRDSPASAAAVQAAELPAWLKVSIFAGTLLGVTWLTMAVFW